MRRFASTSALVALFLIGVPPSLAESPNAFLPVSAVVPPCSGKSAVQVPESGAGPLVQVWRQRELQEWQPMDCYGFGRLEVNMLAVTLGRFRAPGGVASIAERLAKVSALTTIWYYPDDDDGWQPLFTAAAALGEEPLGISDRAGGRSDFDAGDLQAGRSIRYSLSENSLLRPAVYRLTIRERTADRLVYTIVNESELRALFMRVTDPGEMRQLYVLQRDGDDPAGDVWRYSSFVEARTHLGAFLLPPSSYRSRALAYYRYVAGIPTDLERRGGR